MEKLEELRMQIDQLDKEIIEKMAKRQKIVEAVGLYKQQHHVAVFDPTREEYLDQYHTKLSKEYNVSIEFIRALFKLIMDESKRIQNK